MLLLVRASTTILFRIIGIKDQITFYLLRFDVNGHLEQLQQQHETNELIPIVLNIYQ